MEMLSTASYTQDNVIRDAEYSLVYLEYGAALEMLKRQVRHLQEFKADKSWVKKELALKADLALLENYVSASYR